jgi:oligosaccharide repeat unit polymerase
VSALIGFCAVLVIIAEHFDRVKNLEFLDGWRKIAQAENDMRYQASRRPMPFSLLNAALYSSALFGGLLFSEQRFGSKILAMLPITISVIYSIVTTAKASAIQSFVMWFSAYISGTLYFVDIRNDTGRRPELVFMACVGFLASIILLLTQSFRYGVTIATYCATIGNIFESYILAGLPPFVSWVHNTSIMSLSQDMGKWTFPGLFELAGFDKRIPGIYSDVFTLDRYSSNLYTVFRGLILDFGLPASLIMTFILGIVADRAYRSVARHKATYIGILSGLYSLLLWSPIISLFVYNAVLAAVIIFAFYTVLAEFWMQSRVRKDRFG